MGFRQFFILVVELGKLEWILALAWMGNFSKGYWYKIPPKKMTSYSAFVHGL